MIVDTSAIVAVALQEDGFERLKAALVSQPVKMSSVTLFEARIVLESSRLGFGREAVDHYLESTEMQVVDFTNDHVAVATAAYRRYGKGNHPARLNMGDCAAYATAKLADEPLLYVGNDFAQTDIVSALP